MEQFCTATDDRLQNSPQSHRLPEVYNMTRHLSPLKLAFTLSLLTLGACDQSPLPTSPQEPATSTAAAAVSYTVRNLGIFSEIAATATSINVGGQVVGFWFRPDDE